MFLNFEAPQNSKPYLLILLLSLLIFVFDGIIKLEVATAAAYVIVVLIASHIPDKRAIWMAATLCSLLTLLGFLFSPGQIDEVWKVLANRGLSIVLIVMTAFFLAQRKTAVYTQMQLNALRKHSHDAIISITQDGTIISWNRGATELFGYQKEDIMGQSINCLMPTDRMEEIKAIGARLAEGKSVDVVETVRVHKDGTPLHVLISVAPLSDPYGKIIGVSSIIHDITKRKMMELAQQKLNERLAATNRKLEENNQELKHFAYVASHDLQEPLRAVSSYVQLLARRYAGQLDDDADDFIAFAVDGAERMKTLIDDLLTYSRLNRDEQPLVPVSLDNVMEIVCRNLQIMIEDSSCDIRIMPLPTVFGNENQLVQLFQNIISNGIKFQKKNVRPIIEIRSVQQNEEWVISIHDNGIGIDAQFQEKIFEIFQRLHSRDDFSGTGIGLSICKKIVKGHGGEIWVESTPGEGATFYFTLPMLKETAVSHLAHSSI